MKHKCVDTKVAVQHQGVDTEKICTRTTSVDATQQVERKTQAVDATEKVPTKSCGVDPVVPSTQTCGVDAVYLATTPQSDAGGQGSDVGSERGRVTTRSIGSASSATTLDEPVLYKLHGCSNIHACPKATSQVVIRETDGAVYAALEEEGLWLRLQSARDGSGGWAARATTEGKWQPLGMCIHRTLPHYCAKCTKGQGAAVKKRGSPLRAFTQEWQRLERLGTPQVVHRHM
eukprot:Sspe_Gene.79716::Locus_50040_Transcript_1_1_Confidence_1.000_Length_725::g.79716::m.79716